MIRFILLCIFFFLAYTVYQTFRVLLGGGRKKRPDRYTQQGEQMVQDAYDGTFIPISQSVKATMGGKTLYFATKENRNAYKKTH